MLLPENKEEIKIPESFCLFKLCQKKQKQRRRKKLNKHIFVRRSFPTVWLRLICLYELVCSRVIYIFLSHSS